MSYVAADAWCTEWRTWDRFADSRDLAYSDDSLRLSHPIEQTVDKPSDATFLVDPISYEKGCSVLYQMEQFIGEETFRDGHQASTSRSTSSATPIRATCGKASSKPVMKNGVLLPIVEIMKQWVFQTGHPEVIVSQATRSSIVVRQQPFLFLKGGRRARKLWDDSDRRGSEELFRHDHEIPRRALQQESAYRGR